MNFVRNLILSLVFGGVVSLAVTTTQAADFKYQFAGTEGTVSGAITLSEDGPGRYKATSLTVDEYTKPNGTVIPYRIHLNFDKKRPHDYRYNNEFTMKNGQIYDYRLLFVSEDGTFTVRWGNVVVLNKEYMCLLEKRLTCKKGEVSFWPS
ncbi:MAG: hypothetical protein JKY04_01825 [Sneathiella sp.]|nr:hypothetical protein [Sneathiella sp.]